MELAKKLAKATLSVLGYEVRKKRGVGDSFPSEPFEAQRQLINDLNKTNILIFDVGASKGQTAKIYRSKFPGRLFFREFQG